MIVALESWDMDLTVAVSATFARREQQQQQRWPVDRGDRRPRRRAPPRLLGMFPVDQEAKKERCARTIADTCSRSCFTAG